MTLQFLRPVLLLGKLQVPGLDYISFLFFLCPTFGVQFIRALGGVNDNIVVCDDCIWDGGDYARLVVCDDCIWD